MRLRARIAIPIALTLALVALAALSAGSAFRDNDQAMLIYGGKLLASGQSDPFYSALYNYDKQWGSYWLLGASYRLTPRLDPVLVGNILQMALLVPALLLALWTVGRRLRTCVWLYLPVFLSPALILYLPFLSTASLSLSFLLLTFVLLRSRWRFGRRWLSLVAIAAAASCRGDVILAAPLLALSITPRASFIALLRRWRLWLLGLAAIAPVLLGKIIDIYHEPSFAGFLFSAPLIAGYVAFAFGVGALSVLLTLSITRARLTVVRRSWRFFYAVELGALLIPVAFYWTQLFSPRYFYLTLAVVLFSVSSRRTAILARGAWKPLRYAVVAVTLLPWIVGIRMPHADQPRLALTRATLFPTADGAFPMGAFLSFAVELPTRDRFETDHNQKVWESAKSVDYDPCPDGKVPLIGSPMRDYLLLATQLQGKKPWFVDGVKEASCGRAYLDSRSLVRGEIDPAELGNANLSVVSRRPELGRPILLADVHQAPSPDTESWAAIRGMLNGLDAEVFFKPGGPQHIRMLPEFFYFFGSIAGECEAGPPQPGLLRVPASPYICYEWRGRTNTAASPGAMPEITLWGHTVFPDYIHR